MADPRFVYYTALLPLTTFLPLRGGWWVEDGVGGWLGSPKKLSSSGVNGEQAAIKLLAVYFISTYTHGGASRRGVPQGCVSCKNLLLINTLGFLYVVSLGVGKKDWKWSVESFIGCFSFIGE